MFIATFLAKVLKSFLEIEIEFPGLGRFYTATGLTRLSRLETSILLSVIFLIVGIVFYKVDVEKVMSKLRVFGNPANAVGFKEKVWGRNR